MSLLSACASAPGPLASGEWRVTAINGHATPVEGSYRMQFEGGQAGGQFGCNHFGGEYRVRGEVMTVGAVTMTEMACMGPAGEFESMGMRVLQQPMRMEWRGASALRLSNGAGSIELVQAN